MTDILKSLIQQPDVVAITFRRTLIPVEGADTPIFPATYPAPERGSHRFDTPYTVNQIKNGTLIVDIDSVQSQANRMEAVFSGTKREWVPQHAVQAGDRQVLVTDLPHRIADAAIRATDLAEVIHAAMLDYAKGKPSALAKLSPTSLIYGAWDSRDTHVKIPRAVRAEIRAFDCSILTRSAQFTGTFSDDDLGLSNAEWKKGADAGFASTPSINAHGGVLVHDRIIHTATILLPALRRYQTADEGRLAPYLLGLALAGVIHATRDYNLRSGCWLVPNGAPTWQQVMADGTRTDFVVVEADLDREIQNAAQAWAAVAKVSLGGEPTVHKYDPNLGKAMIRKAQTKGQAPESP